MSKQIPLDLRQDPDHRFETFIVSATNREAAERVKAWPSAGFPILLIVGEHGSGKTHLGTAWLKQTAQAKRANAHSDQNYKQYLDHHVWLDDADQCPEDVLFTLLNMALNGEVLSVLMTARFPAQAWNIDLPDLKSRLNNTPSVVIHPPDDDILEPVLRKLFEDKGRQVDRDLIDYLLKTQTRSIGDMRSVVDDLDLAAREAKKDLTKYFAARFLKQN